MRASFIAIVVLLSLAIGACGDDTGPVDAALPDAADDAGDTAVDASFLPTPPAPPVPSALPVLTPCPPGWREVPASGGVSACDPWPESGRRDDCPVDAAHFPGEADCARIGTECPVGGFPAGLPAGADVLYVQQGASGPADGTLAMPFATIGEALAAAAPGAIVAVAAGMYVEDLTLPADVTLWGACVRDTVLSSASVALDFEAVVHVDVNGVALRNLTIADTEVAGVFIGPDGAVRLEDLVIRDTTGYGVVGRGGEITADSVLIDGTNAYTAGRRAGTRGRGVQASGGAVVDFERVVVSEPSSVGLASFFSDVRVVDFAVVDSIGDAPVFSVPPGFGVDVQGGTFVATRSVIEDSMFAGLRLAITDSADLTDMVVRGTRHSVRVPSGGFGFILINAGTVTATRLWLDDNTNRSLSYLDFVGDGTELALRDSIISRTLVDPEGGNGMGVEVRNDLTNRELSPSVFEVERVLVSANAHRGVFLRSPSVRMRGSDLTILDTVANGESGSGIALAVTSGADAELERIRIEQGTGVGILLQGGRPDLSEGGSAELRRSDLRATDVSISDTSSTPEPGTLGRAIQVEFGALSGSRFRLERNREVALMAFASSVSLSDLAVVETLGASCADACPVDAFGHAIYKGPRAEVYLETFLVDSAVLCGVVVDGDGLMALSDGVVRGAEIGACVQAEDYDLSLLSQGVLYEDNVVNLDATSLPVPDYLVE